jgi:hypothetical protein
MTSGQDVSEYLDTLGLVKSHFSSFLREKNKKIEGKKCLGAPTSPEDQVICLFGGFLPNPDMTLTRYKYKDGLPSDPLPQITSRY